MPESWQCSKCSAVNWLTKRRCRGCGEYWRAARTQEQEPRRESNRQQDGVSPGGGCVSRQRDQAGPSGHSSRPLEASRHRSAPSIDENRVASPSAGEVHHRAQQVRQKLWAKDKIPVRLGKLHSAPGRAEHEAKSRRDRLQEQLEELTRGCGVRRDCWSDDMDDEKEAPELEDDWHCWHRSSQSWSPWQQCSALGRRQYSEIGMPARRRGESTRRQPWVRKSAS